MESVLLTIRTCLLPVEEIARTLDWKTHFDQEEISLNGHLLDAAHLRKLTNGTLLVPLDELQRAGARPLPGAMTECRRWWRVTTKTSRFSSLINASRWIWRTSIYAPIRERDSCSTVPSAVGAKERRRPGRVQNWANQIADASLPALSQRPDAVECAGAREYFYSRIPEGSATSVLARLYSPALNGGQSREMVLQLDRPRHTVSIKGHWPLATTTAAPVRIEKSAPHARSFYSESNYRHCDNDRGHLGYLVHLARRRKNLTNEREIKCGYGRQSVVTSSRARKCQNVES